MRPIKNLLSVAAIASLILVGPLPRGYSEQGPDAVNNPRAQEPIKHQHSISRPQRYPQSLAGLEVLADLTVTPATYNGQCPVTFTSIAKIGVNRASVVHLRFVRNDNTRSDPVVLVFEKPETKEITKTWQFDNPSNSRDFSGWQAVQISYPMKVQSNTAYFRGTCINDRKQEPKQPAASESKPQANSHSLNLTNSTGAAEKKVP